VEVAPHQDDLGPLARRGLEKGRQRENATPTSPRPQETSSSANPGATGEAHPLLPPVSIRKGTYSPPAATSSRSSRAAAHVWYPRFGRYGPSAPARGWTSAPEREAVRVAPECLDGAATNLVMFRSAMPPRMRCSHGLREKGDSAVISHSHRARLIVPSYASGSRPWPVGRRLVRT
jgi:hypothetical protein